MENDRWSDGRLARPASALACAGGGEARRSIANIRNFCQAADSTSIKEAVGIDYGSLEGVRHICPASTHEYLPCS